MMFVIRERSGEGRFMCVMGVCCHRPVSCNQPKLFISLFRR
jgi:hypothetical protein